MLTGCQKTYLYNSWVLLSVCNERRKTRNVASAHVSWHLTKIVTQKHVWCHTQVKSQMIKSLIGLSVKSQIDVDRAWDLCQICKKEKEKKKHFFCLSYQRCIRNFQVIFTENKIYDTFTDSLPRMCVICIRDFQVSSRQWSSKMRIVSLQLTKFIAHCPGLIIVKMNVSLPVCPWEKSMSQDPTRAIKGQIITMPVPNIGHIAII